MATVAPSARPAAPRRTFDAVRVGQLALPLALLALWQVAGMLAGEFYVATPVQALDVLTGADWFWGSLGATLAAVGVGFAIAAVAGLWIGIALGLSRFWGGVFEPITLSVYSIPKVTLFPLFLLFLGLGATSTALFGAFHGVFPLTLMLMAAIRSTPDVLFKVGRVYRLNRWQVFTRIVVPETLPALVTGIRYCFSLTFLGVILAEMFAARAGAGHELMQAISLNNVARIFAVAVTLVLVALAVNGALLMVQRAVGRRRGGGWDENEPR